jgi:hypothetical protein
LQLDQLRSHLTLSLAACPNTIHVPPLPQQLIPTTSSLLHLVWAHLGYITQLSGRLSVLWLTGNLAISLFLA